MEKTLRIIFIILLFGILGMQVYFLIEKNFVAPNISNDEATNIAERDSGEVVIDNTTHATKAQTILPQEKKLKEPKLSAKAAPYSVNSSQCISCGLCVPNCPVDAISMKDGVAVIDSTKCISCGICKDGNGKDFQGCPVSAITQP